MEEQLNSGTAIFFPFARRRIHFSGSETTPDPEPGLGRYSFPVSEYGVNFSKNPERPDDPVTIPSIQATERDLPMLTNDQPPSLRSKRQGIRGRPHPGSYGAG
jgi:hypothetical protein